MRSTASTSSGSGWLSGCRRARQQQPGGALGYLHLDDEIVFEFDANGSDLKIWIRNEHLLRSVAERIDRTP
jgi:hypothetical protein